MHNSVVRRTIQELRWGLHVLTRLVPAADEDAMRCNRLEYSRLQNAAVWIYGVNQGTNTRKLYKAIIVGCLEVLRDARVSLLREHGRVLNPRVPPRRDIPDDRLLTSAVWIAGPVRALLVVALVSVIVIGVACAHARVLARSIRTVGGRVGRRCVRGSTLHTSLVLCRVWRSTANGTKRTETIRVHCLATSVHQRVIGSFGIGAASRGVRGVVAARVAVAVGEGHAAGEGGGGLAVRAGCGVAPAAVAAGVFSHLGSTHANCRKRGIVVGVEAILLNLLPALFLIVLASLALPPPEDAAQNEQCDDNNGHDDGDCNLAA